MRIAFLTTASTALMLLLVESMLPVAAQPPERQQPLPPVGEPIAVRLVGRPDLIEKRVLRVRNIKADDLVAWFDATRIKPPFPLPVTVLGEAAQVVKLPAGVESIIPIPQQNVIHAFGSSAGLDELQKILDVVDKPLRQFEVTMWVVQIENWDLAKLLPTQN